MLVFLIANVLFSLYLSSTVFRIYEAVLPAAYEKIRIKFIEFQNSDALDIFTLAHQAFYWYENKCLSNFYESNYYSENVFSVSIRHIHTQKPIHVAVK